MVKLREDQRRQRVAETLSLSFGYYRAVTIVSGSHTNKSGKRKSEQSETVLL